MCASNLILYAFDYIVPTLVVSRHLCNFYCSRLLNDHYDVIPAPWLLNQPLHNIPPRKYDLMIRAYEPLVSLNKALLNPYFLRWAGLGGGRWTSHECRIRILEHDDSKHVIHKHMGIPGWWGTPFVRQHMPTYPYITLHYITLHYIT